VPDNFRRVAVDGLRFSYGRHTVLDGVSLYAGKGEILSVLGANGAGKSTLFACILGFRREFGGKIEICGEDVRSVTPRTLAKRIAFVPQSHAPVFNYTVRDMALMGTTARLGGISQPGEQSYAAADDALRRVGIEELAERGYTQISGGERQLTLIARALAQQAKILIMDEPTANLDFGNQIRVLSRVKDLAAGGYTVILSTHNPAQAKKFSDRIIALKSGRVAASGSPDTLTAELICELYGLSRQEYDSYNC